FGYYRQMERTAKLHGLNVSYQSEFIRLIRQETEQTNLASQAKLKLASANRQLAISTRAMSIAAGLGRGALSLLGGPLGVATLAATAIYEFNQSNKVARQSALDLKDAVVQTTAELLRMSQAKIAVKVDDYQEQLEGINKEREKVKNELTRYSDTRLNLAKSREDGALSFLFPSANSLQKEKNQLLGQLEDLNSAAERTQQNLINARIAATGKTFAIDTFLPPEQPGNTGPTGDDNNNNPWTGDGGEGKKNKEKVDQFKQLRQQIEEAHASSLGRINLQEVESNRQLQDAAKKYGASDADLQRVLLLNAENYQKQRLDLAAQYSPVKETLLKEQEGSRELESIFKARLLTEQEYQTARITLARDTAKELLQAQADEIAAPKLDIAGEVDPLVSLRNQLAQRQSLLQAYYTGNAISKDQYEMLMQKATKESADAQYQTSLELYRSQGEMQSLAVGLFETAHERSSNFLTSMLTRTRSFKENMADLFSSLTQSIIKNLVDMAAQALVTSSVMQTIMGVVGAGVSIAGGVSGAADVGAGTAIQNAGNNFNFQIPGYAKGGVFDSPSLSAYSNQVYDSPQFFAFAKGAGVFGEAGPEAIMPLTRAGDGSLGVRAVGGGQNAGASEGPKVYITIEGGNTSTQAPSGFEQFGQQIGSFVEKKYRELMAQDMRPGGMVWNAVKGQR
ncbi:phage tail tape measure protein, partial [Klebsiella pneumoniae]